MTGKDKIIHKICVIILKTSQNLIKYFVLHWRINLLEMINLAMVDSFAGGLSSGSLYVNIQTSTGKTNGSCHGELHLGQILKY